MIANRRIRILGVSGSLRARSTNTEVLRALASLAPAEVEFALFEGLGELPHFNPDLDEQGTVPPSVVEDFRNHLRRADALVICSPEYAHGVPGSLKNALDWVVSMPDLYALPVGVINASPRSVHAHASLVEILRTMSMIVVPGASITLPLNGRRWPAAAMVQEPTLSASLLHALDALVEAAITYRGRRDALPKQ